MPSNSGNGIVSQPSAHSVDATVEKLQAMLQSKGVTLFAVIDHSGEAQKSRPCDAADQAPYFRQS